MRGRIQQSGHQPETKEPLIAFGKKGGDLTASRQWVGMGVGDTLDQHFEAQAVIVRSLGGGIIKCGITQELGHGDVKG